MDYQSKKNSLKEEHKIKHKTSKPIAPIPELDNKDKKTGKNLISKKSGMIVDISKFVQEAKGDLHERYSIKKVLGSGAYGEVSLIVDKITKNQRAMKLIPKKDCGGSSNSAIISEIEMLKALDHPNILKIFEFYQDDENYYLVTEYCSGGELYDRIISTKNFSERMASDLMRQILSAVTYCHERKIVHR